MRTTSLVRAALVITAAFNLGAGLWALFAPESFFDALASEFDPYNVHFIHDIGAFMAGLGATALLALVWSDGWSVALGGNAVAALGHLGSHIVDRDIGSSPGDPFGLLLFSALLVGVLAKLRLGSEEGARSGENGRA
jgi:hypothetical protein